MVCFACGWPGRAARKRYPGSISDPPPSARWTLLPLTNIHFPRACRLGLLPAQRFHLRSGLGHADQADELGRVAEQIVALRGPGRGDDIVVALGSGVAPAARELPESGDGSGKADILSRRGWNRPDAPRPPPCCWKRLLGADRRFAPPQPVIAVGTGRVVRARVSVAP